MAQGQTMMMVVVWLPDPVFSHGQLYVGCGRVGAPERLKLAVRGNVRDPKYTRNVVYREVLTDTGEMLMQTQPEPPIWAPANVSSIL